jgi:hypothetical protein
LGRLITTGQVFGFPWQGEFWIPMFQFDAADLNVRPAVHQVLAELIPTFDGWATCTWFVHPNTWLRGRCPIDVPAAQLDTVVQVARGDRFVADG